MSDLQATDLMWFADTVGDILLLFFYRDCSFSSDAFITFLSCNKIVQNFCVLYCHSAVARIWLRRSDVPKIGQVFARSEQSYIFFIIRPVN